MGLLPPRRPHTVSPVRCRFQGSVAPGLDKSSHPCRHPLGRTALVGHVLAGRYRLPLPLEDALDARARARRDEIRSAPPPRLDVELQRRLGHGERGASVALHPSASLRARAAGGDVGLGAQAYRGPQGDFRLGEGPGSSAATSVQSHPSRPCACGRLLVKVDARELSAKLGPHPVGMAQQVVHSGTTSSNFAPTRIDFATNSVDSGPTLGDVAELDQCRRVWANLDKTTKRSTFRS